MPTAQKQADSPSEERWAQKNKDKVLVHRMVTAAIKRGVIKRVPCLECGEIKTVAHHPDYSKPLEIIFLCKVHHYQAHKKSS